MNLKAVNKLFKDLNLNLSEGNIKDSFLMMDTNADDLIDVPEFLGMIDYIIDPLIPDMIFEKLNMKPQQQAMKLVGLMVISVLIILFIVISMGAFHVEVGKGAAGMGASLMRAGIAIVAVLGLRRDSDGDD